MRGEPVAYIVGHKEFYGLDFKVDENTLIPRPETELLVEKALSSVIGHPPRVDEQSSSRVEAGRSSVSIIDVGTGSGNIIISIANELKKVIGHRSSIIGFFGIDISKDALKIAKNNAKTHGVDKKIDFLHGDLLSPIIGNWKLEIGNSTMIIVANLPYLSKEIFASAPIDVKKYEPKSALYSSKQGLSHYEKLLKQIKKLLFIVHCSLFVVLELSPEQKTLITKMIKKIFPSAKIEFFKDLAGKWRVCKIIL